MAIMAPYGGLWKDDSYLKNFEIDGRFFIILQFFLKAVHKYLHYSTQKGKNFILHGMSTTYRYNLKN